MAMNSICWTPNWFELEISEMERQVSNWCNLNSREMLQVVFNTKDMKAFLKRNKLHKNTDGRHFFFSTPNLVMIWNEMEENWGFVYQIKNGANFEEILYQAPKSPAETNGIAYANPV